MTHRLLVLELATDSNLRERAGTAEQLQLDGERAHYLHRVLRLKPSAELTLLDGQGGQWPARIESGNGRRLNLTLSGAPEQTPPPKPLVLAQAWLKGGAMDRVVQKAVELGATTIWLVQTERSNVRLDARRLASKHTHLERVAASALEQSGGLWLPEIVLRSDLAEVLEARGDLDGVMLDLQQPVLDAGTEPVPLLLLVGPEGGWSDAERTLAGATPGVRLAGLGPLTLRAETAPLAALAAIRHSWGWVR